MFVYKVIKVPVEMFTLCSTGNQFAEMSDPMQQFDMPNVYEVHIQVV